MGAVDGVRPKLTVGRLVERLRDVLALQPFDKTGMERDITSPNVSDTDGNSPISTRSSP